MRFETQSSILAAGFFVFIFLVLASAVSYFFITELQRKVSTLFYQIQQLITKSKRRTKLLSGLASIIYSEDISKSSELVFHLFTDFYKNNREDIENSAFPKEFFPNGKKDLMDMYKWIMKYRPDNYKEFANTSITENTVTVWNTSYPGGKLKIASSGILEFIPIQIEEPIPFDTSRFMLKYENMLYDLDTEKSSWILQRRKFFNI